MAVYLVKGRSPLFQDAHSAAATGVVDLATPTSWPGNSLRNLQRGLVKGSKWPPHGSASAIGEPEVSCCLWAATVHDDATWNIARSHGQKQVCRKHAFLLSRVEWLDKASFWGKLPKVQFFKRDMHPSRPLDRWSPGEMGSKWESDCSLTEFSRSSRSNLQEVEDTSDCFEQEILHSCKLRQNVWNIFLGPWLSWFKMHFFLLIQMEKAINRASLEEEKNWSAFGLLCHFGRDSRRLGTLESFSHSLSQLLGWFACGEAKRLLLNSCRFGGSAQLLRVWRYT